MCVGHASFLTDTHPPLTYLVSLIELGLTHSGDLLKLPIHPYYTTLLAEGVTSFYNGPQAISVLSCNLVFIQKGLQKTVLEQVVEGVMSWELQQESPKSVERDSLAGDDTGSKAHLDSGVDHLLQFPWGMRSSGECWGRTQEKKVTARAECVGVYACAEQVPAFSVLPSVKIKLGGNHLEGRLEENWDDEIRGVKLKIFEYQAAEDERGAAIQADKAQTAASVLSRGECPLSPKPVEIGGIPGNGVPIVKVSIGAGKSHQSLGIHAGLVDRSAGGSVGREESTT
ncbi:hypothetical protein C8R44DRAFT_755415 [Mycena epipterygia]|nr:hypothetical protein C8R44DRAFT_755415 [Mycena epipterygia]